MYGLPKRVCVLCIRSQRSSRCSFYMFDCIIVGRKLSTHLGV